MLYNLYKFTKMATKTLCCSVSLENYEKMVEMGHSASKLLQIKILEMWECGNNDPETLKTQLKKIENWKKMSQKLKDFIEKKGLINDWYKEEGVFL